MLAPNVRHGERGPTSVWAHSAEKAWQVPTAWQAAAASSPTWLR